MRGDVASQVIRAYLTSHDDLPQIFESPACVEVMESDSLDGFVFLQIDRALALSMIDRILGGGTHPAPRVRRPLTEIETSLLQRITERMRDALSNALQLESTHRLRTVAIESQPERLPRPDNGEMALIDATLSVPRTQGHYRVGMPLAMLDRLADTRCVPSHAESESVVQNLPLEGLAVIAGNVRLRSDEAHALHVGQTVFADRTLPRVYVNRKLMYSGQLGTSGEKKAVRIDTVHERAKQAEEAEAPRNSVVLR